MGDSETNGNINLSFSEGTENSKILRLRDHKKPIILLAPTPSECSLWIKRIIEAKKKFMENEKSRLQKQRSSKLYLFSLFLKIKNLRYKIFCICSCFIIIVYNE